MLGSDLENVLLEIGMVAKGSSHWGKAVLQHPYSHELLAIERDKNLSDAYVRQTLMKQNVSSIEITNLLRNF